MTGQCALICSVDCLAHTSPHVRASLGLPAAPIARSSTRPPVTSTPRTTTHTVAPPTQLSQVLCVVPSFLTEEEVGTGPWSTAADVATSIASEG